MITLPPRGTDEGAETRLLRAECLGPSIPNYNLNDAITCMQLMDLVLWNRVKKYRTFLARNETLFAVITAPGQFQGFQHYPLYDNAIVHNLQQMVDIANDPRDKRATIFTDFINSAIRIARVPTIPDPSPGELTGWRTAGTGSPGSNFTFFKTVLGTSFYYM